MEIKLNTIHEDHDKECYESTTRATTCGCCGKKRKTKASCGRSDHPCQKCERRNNRMMRRR